MIQLDFQEALKLEHLDDGTTIANQCFYPSKCPLNETAASPHHRRAPHNIKTSKRSGYPSTSYLIKGMLSSYTSMKRERDQSGGVDVFDDWKPTAQQTLDWRSKAKTPLSH